MNGALAEAERQVAKYCAEGRVRSGVTVIFVTSNYSDAFRSWFSQPGAPCKDDILLVACDQKVEDVWRREGLTVLAVPTDGSLSCLWQVRLDILASLCSAGVDFFHSDADALWIRDPRTYCCSLNADLVFSQGTVCPREAVRSWGFVLCCGFFYVRASATVGDFFDQVRRRCAIMSEPHDQVAFNNLLLKRGMVWEKPAQVSEQREFRGETLRYFPEPVRGRCQAANLDFCLLPHRLFPRLGPTNPEVMVEHLLERKLAKQSH